jgi:hypothetical protein
VRLPHREDPSTYASVPGTDSSTTA